MDVKSKYGLVTKTYVLYTKQSYDCGRLVVAVCESLEEAAEKIRELIKKGRVHYGDMTEKQLLHFEEEYRLIKSLKDEEKAINLINEELREIVIEPNSFWLKV